METDTPVSLAWTVVRNIVVSTGLLSGLGAAERRGVLCHESSQWRRGDGIALRAVWAFSWPLAVTYNVGMALAGARYGTPQSPAELEPKKGSGRTWGLPSGGRLLGSYCSNVGRKADGRTATRGFRTPQS